MTNCPNCGAEARDENAIFCHTCGARLDGKPCDEPSVPDRPYDESEPIEIGNCETIITDDTKSNENKDKETSDVLPDATPEAEEDNTFGILAYLGPLVFIPLFAKPKSKFMQYHARQGLTLLAVEAVTAIISTLLLLIKTKTTETLFGIPYEIAATPWWTQMFAHIFAAAILLLIVIGIVRVETKQMKPLPLIGKLDIIALFEKKKKAN